LAVTPEESDAHPEPDEPAEDASRDDWALDAALGAASGASRAAGAVGRSFPGRAVSAAARFVTAPLSEEGREVRERAGPAAREAVRNITPEVVEVVDLNEILDAIDVNALLDRIDMDRLVSRIDVSAIVSQVDVNELVGALDVQGIIDRVDIDGIISKVDLNALLDRIDVGALLDRIDLDAVLDRIDIAALLDRIDINELVSRVDMDRIMSETELGAIIAQSTTGVASEALDAVRRQGVGLDNVMAALANRVMRRDPSELPAGPPRLVEPARSLTRGENPSTPSTDETLGEAAGPADNRSELGDCL
jgi:hypothetical protein